MILVQEDTGSRRSWFKMILFKKTTPAAENGRVLGDLFDESTLLQAL